jgi:hypothetical protein
MPFLAIGLMPMGGHRSLPYGEDEIVGVGFD